MPGKLVRYPKYPKRRTRREPLYVAPRLLTGMLTRWKGSNKTNHTFHIKLKHITFIGSDGAGVINSNVNASLVTSAQNYTALSTLYDAFSVKAMKVKYVPLNIGAEAVSGATNPYVRGTTVDFVDIDGTNIPTTVAASIEYGNAKIHNPRVPFSRYWKINKRLRSQLNDFNTGWNTQNKDTAICLNSDSNLPVSTNMFLRYTTFYVTCYGLR